MKKIQNFTFQLKVICYISILFLSIGHVVMAQSFEVVQVNPIKLRQVGCSNTFDAPCLQPSKPTPPYGSLYYWDASSGTFIHTTNSSYYQHLGGTPAPCSSCTISISSTAATPQTIAPGGSSTLSYTISGTYNSSTTGYQWSDGFQQVSPTVYPTATTTYTLTVTDFSASNCSATGSVTVYVTQQSPCSISTITASPSACNTSTNTYSTSGYIYFSNPPSSGTLTVSDGTASQTLYAPFTSPLSYYLTGITANGSTHTVNASFSAASCSKSTTYTAPQSCSVQPSCSISSVTASPSACNASTNTYSTSGSIYFSNPPSSGTLTISDGTASQTLYAPFTSPLSYSLTGITANGSTHTVNASFSAASCSKSTTYTAPQSCAVRNCSVSITAIPGTCNSSTNTYSVSGRATLVNAPAGSLITFTDGASSQTYTVPSSQVSTTWVDYTLSNLTANGSNHTVTAIVSNGTSCSTTTSYTAPASCLCTTPTPSVNSPTICSGSSATLSVSNCAGSVTWNDGTSGATRTVSPSFTSNYTATCIVGTCSGSTTATVTVTTISTPTPVVNSPTICSGSSATLSVSNCAGTVTWNDGISGATRTVAPASTTSYIATCTVGSGTCSKTGSATATVTVTTISTPTPVVNSPTICSGSSATLSVSNCAGTVTWNDGLSGATRTVAPASTSYYIATCTVGSGTCSKTGSATATVTVTTVSTPTPSVNSPTICSGSSATLSVSNCAGTVTWNDGLSGATRTVAPASTTSYIATCTVGSGTCSKTGSATATVTVTTVSTPTPSVNSPTICSGSSATLSVSNCAGTVTWNDGFSGATRTVAPASTTSYIATCTVGSGACSGTGTATAMVTVTTVSTPTPVVNSPTICSGSSVTLSVSNCAGTVTWNDGFSGATRTVAPASTTSYIATCTVGSGTCSKTGSATATVTVTTVSTPTPVVNSPTICSGSSVTLSVSNCAGTVTWNDGLSGATRTVAPASTTSYIATCTVGSGTCSKTGTATATVTVTTISTPTPSVNSPTICSGSSATLSVSNCAGTVTWNDGLSGATRTVAPASTTSYIATCTVGSGTCSKTGTATATVTVTTVSTPTPVVNSPTICSGSSATLSVSNCAGTVTWNDGISGATRTVAPASTTSYIATCTVGSGTCSKTGSATATVTVTTISTPTPSVNSPTICSGSSATLSVSNCAGTVTWNDGLSGATRTVAPASTTSYIATCTVGSGACSGTGTATATVTVMPLPNITINNSSITCSSDLSTYSVVFTATTGATITTDKGTVSGNTVINIPSGQTVTITADLNACKATASATKSCSCPTINPPVGSSKEYCEGDVIPTLSVSVDAGLQADWYSTATGGTKLTSGLSYTPTSSGDFYVETINTVSNCKSATRTKVSLVMNPKPTISTQTTCDVNGLTYSVTVTTNATSITADKGTVSGLTVSGVPSGQTVTITATSAKGCKNIATINQSCTSTCTLPSFSASGVSPTCNGLVANEDAKLTIYDITNGDRFGYSAGFSAYTGVAYNEATVISGTSASISNLSSSIKNYIVRVFNGNNACYKDVQVSIPNSDCNSNCTISVEPYQTICKPKTTFDLQDAGSNEEWIADNSNPTPATINAKTGEVSGMTSTGIYKFILRSTLNTTCSAVTQIMVLNETEPIVLCNDGSTSYNIVAPSSLSNVIWYNMAGEQVGTGSVLLVKATTKGLEDSSEAYYYKGQLANISALACELELCCPTKILLKQCCIGNNCIEISIQKH